jgi:hypothetical protein
VINYVALLSSISKGKVLHEGEGPSLSSLGSLLGETSKIDHPDLLLGRGTGSAHHNRSPPPTFN